MPPDAELTPDDMLEQERPDKLEHEIGVEGLPEDYEAPAAPADSTSPDIHADHPSQDTDVDENERYQEGVS